MLLCALYLYGTWAGRRRGSSTAEENEPLSDESKAVSDCEKGIVEASKNKDADDSVVSPLISTWACEIPLTTYRIDPVSSTPQRSRGSAWNESNNVRSPKL